MDAKDNVYLSINFEGHFLIFNADGKPIASVLMPGRERGRLATLLASVERIVTLKRPDNL